MPTGAIASYRVDGQTVSVAFEAQVIQLQILTPTIVRVFVKQDDIRRTSKAIEGDKTQPVPFSVAREEGEGEPGTILEVYQKGYRVKDKIVRYAMVKVLSE